MSKKNGACLASCWLLAVLGSTVSAGEQKPLDRRGYLELGGDPNVFETYRDRPYVFLLKEEKERVTADKTNLRVRHVIAVTSTAGRDRATRVVVFPKRVKVLNVQCASVSPEGKVLRMGSNDLRKKEVGNRVEYTIALQQVVLGSILDFGYESEWEYSLSYDEFVASDRAPVLHARFTGECDDLISMQVILRNGRKDLRVDKRIEGDPASGAGAVCYEFRALEPVAAENLPPPTIAEQPHVIVYVDGLKNWERYYGREWSIWKFVNERRNWNYAAFWDEPYFRQSCNLEDSGEASDLVRSLTKKCTTPEQKIAAVLGFVRHDIHVIQEGGDRVYPIPASETLEARSGSANDAAGLAVAMLRLAGLDVRFVLAREQSAGDWNGNLYSADQFNRFLAWTNGHWLDPACCECGLDDLDWELRGTRGVAYARDIVAEMKNVFDVARHADSEKDWEQQIGFAIHNAKWVQVVDIGSAQEWETPSRIATTQLSVDSDGTLSGKLLLSLTGDAKLAARRELLQADEATRSNWCEERLHERVATAELVESALDGIEPGFLRSGDLDTLHARISYRVSGFLAPGKGAVVSGSFFSPALQDPLGEATRSASIWQPQSRSELDEVTFHIPAGVVPRNVPDVVRATGEFLRYESQFAQKGDVLRFRRLVSRRKVLLPAAAAAGVKAEFAQAVAAEARSIELVAAASAKR